MQTRVLWLRSLVVSIGSVAALVPVTVAICTTRLWRVGKLVCRRCAVRCRRCVSRVLVAAKTTPRLLWWPAASPWKRCRLQVLHWYLGWCGCGDRHRYRLFSGGRGDFLSFGFCFVVSRAHSRTDVSSIPSAFLRSARPLRLLAASVRSCSRSFSLCSFSR